MLLVIKVRLYQSQFIFCVTDDLGVLLAKENSKTLGVKTEDRGDIPDDIKLEKPSLKFRANAMFLQPFVRECIKSDTYRLSVLENLNRFNDYPESGRVYLKLILEPPDKEIIDYAWNDRMLRLAWTRVEVENAFSWLSTLGGAYSALGDYFEDCAEEAGRISVRQYKLSLILGDEGLAARSRLYAALALSQKGNLHTSRNIVRKIAKFAVLTHDKRLLRMCQGVWAKLKYLRSLKNGKQVKEHDVSNGKVVSEVTMC